MPALIALAAITLLAVMATIAFLPRYRRDLQRAHERLDAVERHSIETSFGIVEWSERGDGPPLLVSHGIFHGCDGGLLSTRDLVEGRLVVSPSRLGYLGSTMPADASPTLQADAFAALLDHLDITAADVIGISAGTGAAVQMALRHPDRVRRLVISSGNWPGSPTATAPPGWAKAFYTDRAMWSMKALTPPVMGRMMGVPKGFPRDEADAARMAEMLESVFPIGPRREGAVFDAFVSNPEIGTYPLEELEVPVLILHSVDDPLASHEAAERAAGRIPGATLVSLESGGHLGLGQTERSRREIAAFLAG